MLVTKKTLILSLTVCASIILIDNVLGKDTAILTGNLMYIPTSGIFLIISLLVALRFGATGNHGLAWISFAGYAVSWFIAEMIWIIEELYLKIDPFPSSADIFYLIGYPFLLMFFIAYLQPMRSAITKKMYISAVSISVIVLATSLYFALALGKSGTLFECILTIIYPVFDSIVIIPALLGVSLFFKGKVNLVWTLVCLGTISLFVADTAFLIGNISDTYYTGNPMEILFYWNYILLSFGVYYNLKLFQSKKQDKITDLK